jgi:hypothetical protein
VSIINCLILSWGKAYDQIGNASSFFRLIIFVVELIEPLRSIDRKMIRCTDKYKMENYVFINQICTSDIIFTQLISISCIRKHGVVNLR